jgi:DNA repair protein SbcD/Mre11
MEMRNTKIEILIGLKSETDYNMDREIRLLHTADTHLGYKQYHSEARRKDFFVAFEIVINDAIDMQLDAVVHAGDLFDSRNPTLEDLLETISILSRLKAAGIPFLGIVGNHESKQNTQWLDLLQEMGLAARLGKKPQLIENTAIYGIDSVPRSKIPLFDYSGFEVQDTSLPDNCRKLVVMHQIVQPFPYAEWDCAEVLENLPFKVDAILLGDYHEYEKFKLGETWITYPGSTERNSASEIEPRSYNIIIISDEGLEISKRTVPTRYFLHIPVTLSEKEKPYENIFSVVNEHLEELPGSVVFLEISGDSEAILSFSEIEEYLLKKGALVSRVRDLRIKECISDEALKVTFSDPDHAVADEIKRMSLNDGGLIIDEIVRSPNIPRSRVDEETEGRLSKLINVIDFKAPDFKIRISVGPFRDPESSTVVESSVSALTQETPITPKESPEKKIKPRKYGSKSEKKCAVELSEPREASTEKEAEGKTEGLFEEKPAKTSDITVKAVKKGPKKEKGKVAVPRQYNLGDYL